MLPNGVPAVGDEANTIPCPRACPLAHLSAVDVLDGLLAEEEVDVLLVRQSAHKIRSCRECKGKRERKKRELKKEAKTFSSRGNGALQRPEKYSGHGILLLPFSDATVIIAVHKA